MAQKNYDLCERSKDNYISNQVLSTTALQSNNPYKNYVVVCSPTVPLSVFITLARYNDALERNAQSFMKRTIAAFIGLGGEHGDNVSPIGRLSWGRFASACVGDR